MSDNFYAEFLKTIETNNREIQDARIELKLSQAYREHGHNSFFNGFIVGLGIAMISLIVTVVWSAA